MKKTTPLIFVFLFFVAVCAESLAQVSSDTPTLSNLIIICQRPAPSKPRPRSATFVPITGRYDSQCIRLDFLENIGEMTINVVNHSTGEQSSEFVNSAQGAIVIFISGENGLYSLEIETVCGDSYYSEFEL